MTLRAAFVTVGDTSRLTGGYLYNRRLIEGLEGRGVLVDRRIPCGASPEEQAEAAPGFGGAFDPGSYDVIVVDALARVVCAPHLDRWRSVRPVVALVHELPGVADPSVADRERGFEGPLLRSDRLVAASEHGRRVLIQRGAPETRVAAVQPGFDRFTPGHARRRSEDGAWWGGEAPVDAPPGRLYGIGCVSRDPLCGSGTAFAGVLEDRIGGRVRVLCVAQWIPRKGVLELVRAWRTADRSGSVLDLVGETDADEGYAARVRKAIADDNSIRVHGAVDDTTLADLYASAGLFALPSRYEGYGIVFAEAISHGLPVLTCRVGPIPKLVGAAGALVPPGDATALSEILDLLLSDAGARRKMSAAALRRARELPRWRDTVDGFLDVLRETIEGRGA